MPTTLASNLVSPDQFAEQVPGISKRRLRHWLQENLDGFRDECSIKVGQRLLLDTTAVDVWLKAHREGKKG